LDKFGQVWTSLNKFEQVWTSWKFYTLGTGLESLESDITWLLSTCVDETDGDCNLSILNLKFPATFWGIQGFWSGCTRRTGGLSLKTFPADREDPECLAVWCFHKSSSFWKISLHIWHSLEIRKIKLRKFYKVLTRLHMFRLVWTSLDKFGQVWTSLDKFRQV
jgi:hypothetical protein